MAKKRSFKRALVMAILSMVVCLSMFAGTTFAWFTDSVTSSNNIIKAGNLDIELYYQAQGQEEWTKVGKDTNVFTDTLWEPGHTEVVKFKVVNEGSLDLKYQLGVNIASEVASENVYGDKFNLSDFIKYAIVDGKQNYTTRDEAIAAVENEAVFLGEKEYVGASKMLSAQNDTDSDEMYVTMVVYMPTTIGNEANAKKDAAVPTIKLGISLYATQLASENDSFDNTYDENADYAIEVSSIADLTKALSTNKRIVLANDIVVKAEDMNTTAASIPTAIAVVDGQDVVIDLGGHSITVESGANISALLFVHNSNVTITGKGDLNLNDDGFVVWAKGNSTVNVMDGNLVGGKGETSVFYASSNVAYDPESGYATINVYGGNFDSASKATSDKLNIANVMNHGAGRVVYYGGTFAWNPVSEEFVHADDRKYITLAPGYQLIENDGTWTVAPYSVANAEQLATELASGHSVVLTENVDITEPITVSANDVVIDLGGKAINYNITTDKTTRPITVDGTATVTIKNGVVNSDDASLAIFGSSKIYAENVVFNSAKRGFGMNGSTTTEDSIAEFVNCEFHMASPYTAAYISAKGTYIFRNCILEGGTGVLIRSGNVTLDGCTIIANGYMGKGNEQTSVYVNYPVTSPEEPLADGITYWKKTISEGSVGDCVTIVDNCAGHEIKSVEIKNCKFEVVNSVEVNGVEVATGYAVRYININGQEAKSNIVLSNNTDLNGNAIVTGDIGLVYSEYTVNP